MLAGLLILSLSCCLVHGLDNGQARTPPMGWLSWERFTCNIDCDTYPDSCINEKLYMHMADRIAADGFHSVGYEYINIDDCWSEKERDPVTKRLVADKKRFPSGIKALADYMHSLGLKLGIYGDVGPKTCAGYPAQFGNGTDNYFDIDAQTFAEWGVDSFKFDGCNLDPKLFDKYYPQMTKALNKTKAPILFSCEWPLYQILKGMDPDYEEIVKNCNLFRNYYDIGDSWDDVTRTIDFYAKTQETNVKYNGPGNFFDPDQLIIGDFGLSLDQSRAQFAMWAMWSSPLYMSNDLRKLRLEHKEILQNKKVIAVNQDPLGMMATRVYQRGHREAWSKRVLPDSSGAHSYAVVFLNRDGMGDAKLMTVPMSTLVQGEESVFLIFDLFENKFLGELNGSQNLTLSVNPGGGVRMVKLQPYN